jgi:hypothetical protein
MNDKEILEYCKKFRRDLILSDLEGCNICGKPLKKIDTYTYRWDCECVKKYPELKDLRISCG